jgi:Fe-S cluster assembly protein SufD
VSAVPVPLLEAFGAFPLADGPDAREAMARAQLGGLPTQRAERWKYTSLRPLAARRFAPPTAAPALDPALLAGIPAPRLVFVDGIVSDALSDLSGLPAGVRFAARQAQRADAPMPDSPAPADAHARVRHAGADAVFADLNAALARDGLLLVLADGARAAKPLHVVFASSTGDVELATHLRHHVALGAGASATLVEHHFAAGAHRHLVNHAARVELAEGAELVHARMQDEDAGATLFARTQALLGASARYRRLDLELGGGLSRHELEVTLSGDGAQLDAGGALLATGRRQVDTRLDIRHVARDTRCGLLWRGLAGDRGRVSFHGGIRIAAGADGAAANLSSKNLLLSDQAEINTQPVLEIDADEVQAAHGATVGRLDPGALFYLRSRGVPHDEARGLLTLAFCREALATLADDALVTLLSPRLEARLRMLGTLTP